MRYIKGSIIINIKCHNPETNQLTSLGITPKDNEFVFKKHRIFINHIIGYELEKEFSLMYVTNGDAITVGVNPNELDNLIEAELKRMEKA